MRRSPYRQARSPSCSAALKRRRGSGRLSLTRWPRPCRCCTSSWRRRSDGRVACDRSSRGRATVWSRRSRAHPTRLRRPSRPQRAADRAAEAGGRALRVRIALHRAEAQFRGRCERPIAVGARRASPRAWRALSLPRRLRSGSFNERSTRWRGTRSATSAEARTGTRRALSGIARIELLLDQPDPAAEHARLTADINDRALRIRLM